MAKKKPAAEKEMITETCPMCEGAGEFTYEKPEKRAGGATAPTPKRKHVPQPPPEILYKNK